MTFAIGFICGAAGAIAAFAIYRLLPLLDALDDDVSGAWQANGVTRPDNMDR